MNEVPLPPAEIAAFQAEVNRIWAERAPERVTGTKHGSDVPLRDVFAAHRLDQAPSPGDVVATLMRFVRAAIADAGPVPAYREAPALVVWLQRPHGLWLWTAHGQYGVEST